jgi:hypothetical protein
MHQRSAGRTEPQRLTALDIAPSNAGSDLKLKNVITDLNGSAVCSVDAHLAPAASALSGRAVRRSSGFEHRHRDISISLAQSVRGSSPGSISIGPAAAAGSTLKSSNRLKSKGFSRMTIDPLNPVFAVAILAVAALTGAMLLRIAPVLSGEGRVTALDGLRGYLALGVLIHHGAIWYFRLRGAPWERPPSTVFTQLGETGVALFFMISAFLFFTRVLNADSKKLDWTRLYVSRVLRLAPLYFVAMATLFLMVAIRSGFTRQESWGALIGHAMKWLAFSLPGMPDINQVPHTFEMMAGAGDRRLPGDRASVELAVRGGSPGLYRWSPGGNTGSKRQDPPPCDNAFGRRPCFGPAGDCPRHPANRVSPDCTRVAERQLYDHGVRQWPVWPADQQGRPPAGRVELRPLSAAGHRALRRLRMGHPRRRGRAVTAGTLGNHGRVRGGADPAVAGKFHLYRGASHAPRAGPDSMDEVAAIRGQAPCNQGDASEAVTSAATPQSSW